MWAEVRHGVGGRPRVRGKAFWGGVAGKEQCWGKSTATGSGLSGGRLLARGEIHPAEPTLINHLGG